MRVIFALLLGVFASASSLAQQSGIPLVPGSQQTISLNGSSVTASYFIDVPAGSRSLNLQLRASDTSRDVDLLLRHDKPFDLRPEGGVDISMLYDQAHYRSISSGGDEYLIVTTANAVPLRAGRWHLALVNLTANTVSATLNASLANSIQPASIEMVFDDAGTASSPCDTSGWNASEARTPVRGNSGTTLGQQRRLAAQEAARLLTQEISPRVPVRVRACWRDLGDTSGERFTLAQAGPQYIFLDDIGFDSKQPALERPYTWYTSAAAAQQLGTNPCRFDRTVPCASAFDVRATFNSNMDRSASASFDYGFTASSSPSTSFVSVAMHEIAHGLGVIGLVNLGDESNQPLGTKFRAFPGAPLWDDAYGSQVVILDEELTDARPFLRISDAERAVALGAEPRLRFTGPNAIQSGPDVFEPAPFNAIRLHAPRTIAPGSTYSHVSTFNYGIQLMTAQNNSSGPRSLGIGGGILKDVGWSSNDKPAKTFASAPSFQFYDPARNGHGIDFRLISPTLTGQPAEYFMGFYSYDSSGQPEWYIAAGPVIDGVFLPKRNAHGDSLLRQVYLGPNNSVPDSSAGYRGEVRVDFNGARLHPACQDGHPARRLDGPLAIMSVEINSESFQWCMQPVVVPTRVRNDFSSIWYVLGDGGWGMALQSFDGGTSTGAPADGLFSVLFYADAEGKPRWAIAQVNEFLSGQSQPLYQVSGYCRSCPTPANQGLTTIGSLRLDLVRGGAGSLGNRVSFDLTYPGAAGGRFTRNNVELFPNSDPTLGGN
jgi:hypothetical protein